jgi:hypothetical protein
MSMRASVPMESALRNRPFEGEESNPETLRALRDLGSLRPRHSDSLFAWDERISTWFRGLLLLQLPTGAASLPGQRDVAKSATGSESETGSAMRTRRLVRALAMSQSTVDLG